MRRHLTSPSVSCQTLSELRVHVHRREGNLKRFSFVHQLLRSVSRYLSQRLELIWALKVRVNSWTHACNSREQFFAVRPVVLYLWKRREVEGAGHPLRIAQNSRLLTQSLILDVKRMIRVLNLNEVAFERLGNNRRDYWSHLGILVKACVVVQVLSVQPQLTLH